MAAPPVPALALDPSRALHRYVHDHWTSRNGLPQHSILSAAQAQDGYLWFGAFGGIVRSGGVTFKTCDHTTAPILWRNGIFSMLRRRDGDLVFTSPNIVGRIASGRPALVATDERGRLEELLTIAESPAGELWSGAPLDGVY